MFGKYLSICKEKRDSFLILDYNVYDPLMSLKNVSYSDFLLAQSLQSDEKKSGYDAMLQFFQSSETLFGFNFYTPFEERVILHEQEMIVIQRYMLSPYLKENCIQDASVYCFVYRNKETEIELKSNYIFPQDRSTGYVIFTSHCFILYDSKQNIECTFQKCCNEFVCRVSNVEFTLDLSNELNLYSNIYADRIVYDVHLISRLAHNILPRNETSSKIKCTLILNRVFYPTKTYEYKKDQTISIDDHLCLRFNFDTVECSDYHWDREQVFEYDRYVVEPVRICTYRIYDQSNQECGYAVIQYINFFELDEMIQKKLHILFKPFARPPRIRFHPKSSFPIESLIPTILFIVCILILFNGLIILLVCKWRKEELQASQTTCRIN